MSRIALAFSCFFGLLFRGRLPHAAAAFLPADEALPAPVAPPPPEALPPAAPAPAPRPSAARAAGATELRDEGALLLLSLLQREGRLVDFLRESLDGYQDAVEQQTEERS